MINLLKTQLLICILLLYFLYFHSSYLTALSVRFMVQCAYPPPVQGLVFIWLLSRLVGPVGGAIAGLQISSPTWRVILRLGLDELHGFYVCVGFELIPDIKKQITSQLLEN